MFRLTAVSVVVLSAGIVLACGGLLAQLDLPVVLLVRALHVPFLDRLGVVGDRLGDGVTLILLSGGLWGVGWWWRRETWQRAGRDALTGYVLAGVAVQAVKHLVGRPRPRYTHREAFEYGPSLQGGLDAFPSGHTMASFAVAAVLARYWPRWWWVWYGAAVVVGVGRVVGGSHFPTDVLSGAMLGFLVGYVWARPLAEWRWNVVRAMPRVLPSVVGGCAVVWVACVVPTDGATATSTTMFAAGLLLCAVGMGARWVMARTATGRVLYANVVMALGVAVSLRTWWVVAATFMACVVWWMMDRLERAPTAVTRVSREVWLAGLAALWLAVVYDLPGIVPLR